MSRESYDRAADDWRRVADAVHRAGGPDVALPSPCPSGTCS
jgi:hypothetical protein